MVLEFEVQCLSFTTLVNIQLEIKFVPAQLMEAYGGDKVIATFILNLDTGGTVALSGLKSRESVNGRICGSC